MTVRVRLAAGGAVLWPLLLAGSAAGQSGSCSDCPGAPIPLYVCRVHGTIPAGSELCPAGPLPADTICHTGFPHSQRPRVAGPEYAVVPLGGGQYRVRMLFHLQTPHNAGAGSSHEKLDIFWATSSGTFLCENNLSDSTDTYIESGVLTCAAVPVRVGVYSLRAEMMAGTQGDCCRPRTVLSNVAFDVTPEMLGCPVPRKEACSDNASCSLCRGPAACGGSSVAGGGASCSPPGSGPGGAPFHYAAGGVGSDGSFPGTAGWKTALGRNWSHGAAERIVAAPDASRVWLLTRFGTFREFGGLAAGTGLRLYGTRSPRSEYRRLFHDTATGGWQLHDLDGGVQHFLPSGLWDRTVDRAGNVTQAAYTAGRLSGVSHPDGRSETFEYHAGGKLAAIEEAGAGGPAARRWEYTWSGDDLVRIDRPDGTALEAFYDASGRLSRLDLVGTDLTRRVEAAWEHDAQGNVVHTWRGDPVRTGPNAVDVHSFSFDSATLPASTAVTDPLGGASTYALERVPGTSEPRLTRIDGDCPACGVGPNATFEYGDAAHPRLPTVITDGRGHRTQITYNPDGQPLSRLEAAGTALQRETLWEYHPVFRSFPARIETASTSGGPARRVTVLAYDAEGNVLTRTEQGAESGGAFSLATVTAWNAAGKPLTIDPPGHGTADVTAYTYDVPGRSGLLASRRADPLVGDTTYEYDAWNRLTAVTDPNGLRTETVYDALDRVVSVTLKGATAAEDLVTGYAYDGSGALQRVTLPRGNVVEYGYDAAGRMVSIERKPDAATPGERTVYTLDGAGNRTREEHQRQDGAAWVTGSATDYVYTSRCRLEKVIPSAGNPTEYAYDCDGNLEKIWDANHPRGSNPEPTQLHAYDALDRLTSVTIGPASAAPAVTFYGYDIQDHLTSVTDAEGNVTAYVYSDRDLLTRQVSPVSGTTTYGYGDDGELISEIDARGISVAREVDALGRVTGVDYPGAALDILYSYDTGAFGKGRLAAINRGGEPVTYAYDRFGRLTRDGALAFAWDANGNRTRITYPGGVSAVYTHDFADREATLTYEIPGSPPAPLVAASSYEPSGPLASLTLGNGLTETRTFDARYFPVGIAVPGRLAWTYTIDPVGNVTAVADALNPSSSRTYGYQDFHYFLTRGDGPWGTRAWTYDRIGNRLSETKGGVTETWSYFPNPAGGNDPRLSSIASGTGESLFAYDAAGNLILVSSPESQFEYRYDAAGRLSRIGEQVLDTAVSLSYDGRGFLTSSKDEDCACSPVATEPTYSSEGLLYQRTHRSRASGAVSSQARVFYFAGRPVALLDNGTITYLTTDHLGTPALATDAAGLTVWQGGFEPFGADWNGAQEAGVFLRFPGQWEDRTWEGGELASGLYYNVHRWYGTGIGRFTRPDPLGLEGGVNAYLYGLANPIVWIDPLGLAVRCTQLCWLAPGTKRGGFYTTIGHQIFGTRANQLTFDVDCPAAYPVLKSVFLCSKGSPPRAPAEHPFPDGWLSRQSRRERGGYRVEVDVPTRTFFGDFFGLDRVRIGGECCCEN
jgi:RHS repeat-associated protein